MKSLPQRLMRFGSVCSGIEAASVAWHPLGMQAQWFAEIEKFPSKVLAHRWPAVPNLGDMTKLHKRKEYRERAIDLLVGGTPCQSFSVAGLRKGLADPRGNLALHFLKILDSKRPKWVVWENVPGVLSSWSDAETDRGGRGTWQTNDFDTFLCGLREIGYRGGWRVLDAQYFGVPQRRRRVFVVGHIADGARARAVLFESHGLQGNPPPSRKAREDIAPTLSARTKGGGGLGTDFDLDGGLIAKCLPSRVVRHLDPTLETMVAHTLRGEGFDASEDGTGRGTPLLAFHGSQDPIPSGNLAPSLGTNRGREVCMAFHENQRAEISESPTAGALKAGALKAGGGKPGQGYTAIRHDAGVRRITPLEAERLQGFPDHYVTGVPGASDSASYKALGNSMAVPCMEAIGKRILIVENMNNI